MNRPGLLVVTRRYWPMPGGWESTWARLLGELVRRGRKVTVLTPRRQRDWPAETVHGGVRIVRLAPPGITPWSELRYLSRLTQAMRSLRDDYELVLTAGLRGDAYAAVGEARSLRVPVTLQPEQPGVGGDCYWQIEAPCGARIKRRCYRADAYLAATPLLERELIAAGYARSRIHQLPLGTALPEMAKTAERIEARRNLAQADPALAPSAVRKLVVCVGRLRLNKGLGLLLDAWRQVIEQSQQAELWLVGEGPDAPTIRERIFELGLVDSVRLTGAFDDLEDVWRAADAAVCPTLVDGPAVAFLEAASHGLPIVASDVATHRERFADDVEARFYDRNDSAALARALIETLTNAAQATQRGEAARRRTARDYSLSQMADAYEALFAQLLVGQAEAVR